MLLTLVCCMSAAYYASHYRKAQAVFYYERLAEHKTPGCSWPSVPDDETCRYLEEHSRDISLLDDILHDEDPWRRWTAAKTMGDYGERECMSLLRARLNVEDRYVRARIFEAIEELERRKTNGG